jgi:hypothetical protein
MFISIHFLKSLLFGQDYKRTAGSTERIRVSVKTNAFNRRDAETRSGEYEKKLLAADLRRQPRMRKTKYFFDPRPSAQIRGKNPSSLLSASAASLR